MSRNLHCINSTKNGEIIRSWTEITRRRATGPACVCYLWAFSSMAVYFLLFIIFFFLSLFLLPLSVGALNERNERETVFQARPLFVLAEQCRWKIMNSLWIDFNKTVRLTFASDHQDYVLCSWQGYIAKSRIPRNFNSFWINLTTTNIITMTHSVSLEFRVANSWLVDYYKKVTSAE